MAMEQLLWNLGLKNGDFIGKLEESTTRVGVFAQKLNVAFNVAAGGALIGFFQKVVDKAGQIRDTADALGITTDSLQAMDFVAKQAGVSVDQLHGAYGILAGKAADAASGNKQVIESLTRLGISAADFVKLPVDRQLEAIAKGYAAAEDRGQAFAAVADLIGQRNAPRMNMVLQQLAAEGLDGVTASAKKMGQVMSEDTVSTLDGLGDRLSMVKDAAVNVGGTILNAFLKAGEGLGALAGNVVNWAQGMETGYLNAAKSQDHLAAAIETVNVALKGTKATTEEVAKAEESQAKAREAALVAEMDGLGRIQFLREKITRIQSEQAKYDEGTKEYLKAQNDLTETQLKLREALNKQREEEEKKADELMRKSQLDREQALEMVRLQTKGVAALSELERGRYEQLKLITEQKKVQAEIDDMLSIPAEKRTKNESDWLALMVKQNDELQRQIDAKGQLIAAANLQAGAEAGVTAELSKQAALRNTLQGGSNAGQIESQLDVARAQLAAAQLKYASASGGPAAASAQAAYVAAQATVNQLEQSLAVARASSPTSSGIGFSEGAARTIGGMRSYNDPAQQQSYEQGLVASAEKQIEDEIDSIQRRIEQLQTSGATYGQYDIPELEKQINVLRNRQSNARDYLFNPNYADPLGLGIFATQKAVVGGYDTDTVLKNFMQKQSETLTEISDRLAGRKTIFGGG